MLRIWRNDCRLFCGELSLKKRRFCFISNGLKNLISSWTWQALLIGTIWGGEYSASSIIGTPFKYIKWYLRFPLNFSIDFISLCITSGYTGYFNHLSSFFIVFRWKTNTRCLASHLSAVFKINIDFQLKLPSLVPECKQISLLIASTEHFQAFFFGLTRIGSFSQCWRMVSRWFHWEMSSNDIRQVSIRGSCRHDVIGMKYLLVTGLMLTLKMYLFVTKSFLWAWKLCWKLLEINLAKNL